jgi:prevent-host-death family protein
MAKLANMKSIPVSVAKNSLSALLREVRGGATIVITDRGVPVARLAPLVATSGLTPAVIDLAQRGRLVLPERSPNAAWLALPAGVPQPGASAVDALLADRAESL